MLAALQPTRSLPSSEVAFPMLFLRGGFFKKRGIEGNRESERGAHGKGREREGKVGEAPELLATPNRWVFLSTRGGRQMPGTRGKGKEKTKRGKKNNEGKNRRTVGLGGTYSAKSAVNGARAGQAGTSSHAAPGAEEKAARRAARRTKKEPLITLLVAAPIRGTPAGKQRLKSTRRAEPAPTSGKERLKARESIQKDPTLTHAAPCNPPKVRVTRSGKGRRLLP
jgi:hypothetical protein